MKKLLLSSFLWTLLACSPQAPVQADESVAEPEVDQQHLQRMGFQVESIADSPIAGLYQVLTAQGLIYVSADGKNLMSGRIFDITGAEPVNLSDETLNKMRRDDLAEMAGTTLRYDAADEKYVVSVFTDPSCGFCRKLHERMDQYLEAGISIHYLAYPRNGMQSPAAKQLASVWCAADPKAAMSAVKTDERLQAASCDDPVAKHYALGRKFGFSGTPAVVLPNGRLIPGYMPPSQLLSELAKDH